MTETRQQRHRKLTGGAVAGAGTTAAGVGLLGGGIPGIKSNHTTIENIGRYNSKTGVKNSRVKRAGASLSTMRGGIFGYRTDAHRAFRDRAVNNEKYFANKPANRGDRYLRGLDAGKVPAEEKIIRHMKFGRKASGVALVGGTAAVAGGLHLAKGPKKQEVHKAEKKHYRSDTANAALITGGAGAAGVSYGGARVLESQGRKWSDQAEHSHKEAQKIIPKLGPPQTNRFVEKIPNLRVRDVGPAAGNPTPKKISNDYRNPQKRQVLAGKSKAQAEMAGRFHGDASQARYFAGVYGKTANLARKVPKPALGVAGVGALGLVGSRGARKAKEKYDANKGKKSELSKRMSAFGVVH